MCTTTLLGWGITLALISRTTIHNASAFSVLEKMDARFDERINKILQRVAQREEAVKSKPSSRPAAEDQLADARPLMMDESGFRFDEQPDASGEWVDA
jgi:hypothetical protein